MIVFAANNKDIKMKNNNKYGMDDLEIKAAMVCDLWIKTSLHVFPDYKHARFPKGDPRKSSVFKYCYKLVREIGDKLKDEEYQLYVRAQLDIMKHINIDGGHPLISPLSLVGEKAWRRWKLWKKKYDATVNINSNHKKNKIAPTKILEALKKTKDFITSVCGENPTYERFSELESSGGLFSGVNIGKISPYYLVMSPYFEKLEKERNIRKMNFDINVYKDGLSESSMIAFKEMFNFEFA